jgi:hypothetical protein
MTTEVEQAEKRKRLEGLRKVIQQAQAEEHEVLKELGEGSDGRDPIAAAKKREGDAKLYDEMSAAELTRLYEEDRPRWKEILDAKESVGLDKLFKKAGPGVGA